MQFHQFAANLTKTVKKQVFFNICGSQLQKQNSLPPLCGSRTQACIPFWSTLVNRIQVMSGRGSVEPTFLCFLYCNMWHLSFAPSTCCPPFKYRGTKSSPKRSFQLGQWIFNCSSSFLAFFHIFRLGVPSMCVGVSFIYLPRYYLLKGVCSSYSSESALSILWASVQDSHCNFCVAVFVLKLLW